MSLKATGQVQLGLSVCRDSVRLQRGSVDGATKTVRQGADAFTLKFVKALRLTQLKSRYAKGVA
jgi:hypothetical protein